MAELCTALGRRGHRVEMISTTVDGPHDLAGPIGVPVQEEAFVSTVFPVITPREYTTSPALARWLWLNALRFDVVHIHSVYRFTTLAAARICRLRSVPYVFHPHGALTAHHRAHHRGRKWAYELLERGNARHAGATVWESDREQAEAGAAGWPRGSMIWSGVWVPDLDLSRRKQGEVMFLGRLAEKKGVDLLIDAFARVTATHPNAYLRLVGPDPDNRAAALAARAERLGLVGKVRFDGVLLDDAKHEALSSASIHVLPSADESFGAAAIEAMAYGTPTIVTRAFPFAGELEGVNGCVVVDREPEALAQGMSYLLESEERARALGLNAREFVASHFSWDLIAERFEALYLGLTSRPQRREVAFAVEEAL
jgi:glycosyltransferase involved in cell wall biosynthesis